MKVVGIDPGVTGAVAFIDSETGDVQVWDLTSTKISSTNMVSPHALRALLIEIGKVDAVFVEDVHANTMSYKGNFTLGMATGIILGICAALDRPVRRIKPKEWQMTAGLTGVASVERKNTHRQRAMEMWPELESDLIRVKDHNRADALLIAEAGRRTL